ncbi:MAG: hypothetical protein ACK4NC_01490 [Candidatus Gracilibacteria bacterium]
MNFINEGTTNKEDKVNQVSMLPSSMANKLVRMTASAILTMTAGCSTNGQLYPCGVNTACAEVKEVKKYKLVEVEETPIPSAQASTSSVDKNQLAPISLNKDQPRLVIAQSNGSNFVVKQESGNNSRKDARLFLSGNGINIGENVDLTFSDLSEFNGKTVNLIMTSNAARPFFSGVINNGSGKIRVPQIATFVSTGNRDTFEASIDGNVIAKLFVGRE